MRTVLVQRVTFHLLALPLPHLNLSQNDDKLWLNCSWGESSGWCGSSEPGPASRKPD